MKNSTCAIVLCLLALVVASAGCQSRSSSALPNEPFYQPIAEKKPVIVGEYYSLKDVDTRPHEGKRLGPEELKRRSAAEIRDFYVMQAVQFRQPPVYPYKLKQRGISGEATIAFVVSAEGKAEQVQAIRATHGGFADAAVAAVKQWRFTPAMKDGKPVNCLLQVPIAFNLNTDG